MNKKFLKGYWPRTPSLGFWSSMWAHSYMAETPKWNVTFDIPIISIYYVAENGD